MSLNPTPPDRLGTVTSWRCEGTRILTADGKWAGDAANESDAACLVEEHNGSVTELAQALTDLRRERDEFKAMLAEFILQMETSEGVDSDTWKAARLLIHNANKRAHRTPAPLPAPQEAE